MTAPTTLNSAAVRVWLTDNAIDAPWTMPAICEGCGASPGAERALVSDAVRYCVDVGFLLRTETRIGPVYQLTGQAMPRPVLTEQERKQRQRERDARRVRTPRPARKAPATARKRSRAARVDMQAANTPAPAKARPPKAIAQGETVEQFLARGGHIQRLVATWQRAA